VGSSKLCSRCGETKPLDAFAPRRNRPNGRQTWCRQCKSEVSREYWQKTHAARLETSRRWRAEHPTYFRDWARANPDKILAKMQRRRARHKEAEGRASGEAIAARIAFYGGRCWMCGEDADTLDHVIPLARGGSNWPANLRPACRRCNRQKGTRVA
jgi:5-methylcytosine-specific restriction endonuclease McrA